jgi:PilZ domain-containing protein
VERRGQTRYVVRAVAEFVWVDAWGTRQRGQGYTRDISLGGMFIRSETQPPEKADLAVEVSFASFGAATAMLRVKALVIRRESISSARLGPKLGFALLNKSYKLHKGSPFEERIAD